MVFYNTIKNILTLIVVISFLSCEKDSNIISEIPNIQLQNVTPMIVEEFNTPITFTIFYQDGDGNLGENSPDIKNLFLIDLRNNIQYEYRIPMLAPLNSNIAIQGEISIILDGTSIINGQNEQNVRYSIYVIDRSNNFSNTVTTENIKIIQSND